MQKNKLLGIGALALTMITGGVGLYVMNSSSVVAPTGFDARLIYDPTNDRQVVGAHQNVFTGKVVKDLGSTAYDAVPQNQYAIEVVYNIKGDLKGVVTVSQIGSFKEDGSFVSLDEEGQQVTLNVGTTYVFATRYNTDMNWHVLSPHSSGIHVLSKDASLSSSQMLQLSRQDQRVAELEAAYKDEIIPVVDRRSGRQ